VADSCQPLGPLCKSLARRNEAGRCSIGFDFGGLYLRAGGNRSRRWARGYRELIPSHRSDPRLEILAHAGVRRDGLPSEQRAAKIRFNGREGIATGRLKEALPGWSPEPLAALSPVSTKRGLERPTALNPRRQQGRTVGTALFHLFYTGSPYQKRHSTAVPTVPERVRSGGSPLSSWLTSGSRE
jgi:hypothetical protein